MDCAFAIQGNDYVIIASDRSVARSIVKLQDSDDKITILADNQLMATCGEISDRKSFAKLISCELEYYYYVHGNRLTTDEVASFTRSSLAESIRQSPVSANVLIGGVDKDGPKLYWLDYLGTSQKVSKAAHGYGSHFLYGIMDNFYMNDLPYDVAEKCIDACICELRKRFLISMVDFTVYKITINGIEDISRNFNLMR